MNGFFLLLGYLFATLLVLAGIYGLLAFARSLNILFQDVKELRIEYGLLRMRMAALEERLSPRFRFTGEG